MRITLSTTKAECIALSQELWDTIPTMQLIEEMKVKRFNSRTTILSVTYKVSKIMRKP